MLTRQEIGLQCPNGCGQMVTRRGGVGHTKVVGFSCKRCTYACRPVTYPTNEWNPDRAYAAGYSYASGCAE